jgi:hypothetical protein
MVNLLSPNIGNRYLYKFDSYFSVLLDLHLAKLHNLSPVLNSSSILLPLLYKPLPPPCHKLPLPSWVRRTTRLNSHGIWSKLSEKQRKQPSWQPNRKLKSRETWLPHLMLWHNQVRKVEENGKNKLERESKCNMEEKMSRYTTYNKEGDFWREVQVVPTRLATQIFRIKFGLYLGTYSTIRRYY